MRSDIVARSVVASPRRKSPRGLASTVQGQVGLILLGVVLLIAFVGPFVAPVSLSSVVGPPLRAPSPDAWLGTDILGRDVLSRFLHGGWLLVITALLATLLAYVVGVPLGLLSAYRHGRATDQAVRGAATVVYAIPPIIAALVLVTAFGTGIGVMVAAVAATQVAPVVHIFRGLGLNIVTQEYVEAARARGERTWTILIREIAPNVRTLFVAEVGLRFCWAVMLLAAVSFLGFGQAPPAADWGLMISENRLAITSQPLAVVAPALAIAGLTIGLSLVAESIARSIGHERSRS